MAMKLRDYQIDCIRCVELEKENCLISIPCGTGKSLIIAEIAKKQSTLILLDRLTLVQQMIEYLPDASVYCNAFNRKEFGKITIASVASLRRCESIPFFDTIIIDEVHVTTKTHEKIFKMHPNSRLVGSTASPFSIRGYIYGEGKTFEKLTYIKTIEDLSEYLCPVVMKTVQKQHRIDLSEISINKRTLDYDEKELFDLLKTKVSEQVKVGLEEVKERNKIAWIGISIDHAEMIHKELLLQGEASEIIHSKLGGYEEILESFETKKRHIVSVMVISTGYNFEGLDALVLIRPTKSPVLMIQSVGRLLRKHCSKSNALLVDLGKVVENCGTIYNPKLPFIKNNKKVHICPDCNTYSTENVCSCGFKFLSICKNCLEQYKLIDGHKCSIQAVKRNPFTSILNNTFVTPSSEFIELCGVILKCYFYVSKKGTNFLKVSAMYDDGFLSSLDSVAFFFPMQLNSVYFSAKKLRVLGLNITLMNYTKDQIKEIKIDGLWNITYKKGQFNELERAKRID